MTPRNAVFLLPLKTAVFTSISRCFRWPGTGWNMQEAESQSWTGKEAQSWKKAILLKLGQDQESACVPVHHARPEASPASAATAEPATAAATTAESTAAGDQWWWWWWTSSAAADTSIHITMTHLIHNPHTLLFVLLSCRHVRCLSRDEITVGEKGVGARWVKFTFWLFRMLEFNYLWI